MKTSGTVTLRNYRCFTYENPATIEFSHDFIAYVGPNNAGKSAALKAIYELRVLFKSFPNFMTRSIGVHQQSVQFPEVTDPAELPNSQNPNGFLVSIKVNASTQNATCDNRAIRLDIEYFLDGNFFIAKNLEIEDKQGNKKNIVTKNEPNNTVAWIQNIAILKIDDTDISNFVKDLSQSVYFPAFRNAINQGAASYYDIFVGTKLIQEWDNWKAGDTIAHQRKISEIEGIICKLLGFSSLEINSNKDNTSLTVSIDRRQYKLREIGSGISQLIITLATASMMNPSWILIDEPELCLHPSLQLDFITALSAYAKNGVIFSTHSIGLARSCASKIYVVNKLDGKSRMSPFHETKANLVEMLGELSYSSRLQLGCNKILLVEGSTDVLVFQEFLRKIKKDKDYITLSLGGSDAIASNKTHLIEELTRLTEVENIRIFIDCEKVSEAASIPKDREAFVSECKTKLNIDVCVSKLRATENYFEKNGISKLYKKAIAPLDPHEKLNEQTYRWPKSDNWKIARETNLEDIRNTDLWDFLQTL